MIPMIDLNPVPDGYASNKPMHSYECSGSPRFMPNRIETLSEFVPSGIPLPLTQPIKIGLIDDCNLPLRKGDRATRIVRNRVSFLRDQVHVCTSTVQFSLPYFSTRIEGV